MSLRTEWSTRASSRAEPKGTEKPCLEKSKQNNKTQSGAESNVTSGVPAQEVSEGNNIISSWARGNSCTILAKNVTAFHPCPKTLPEASEDLGTNFPGTGDSLIVAVVCLLVNTIRQVHTGQKGTQNVQCAEKRGTRKFNAEATL